MKEQKMKLWCVFLLSLLLWGCVNNPPTPPTPYGMQRIPINPGMTLDLPEVQTKRCCS